jgi:hypothetical protein
MGLPQLGLQAAIVLGLALAIAPTPILAEIELTGSPKAVTIEARDASVEDVLAALGRAFNMDYRSSIDLEKRLLGLTLGRFPGVTRVLEGYNFVLKTDNGTYRSHNRWRSPRVISPLRRVMIIAAHDRGWCDRTARPERDTRTNRSTKAIRSQQRSMPLPLGRPNRARRSPLVRRRAHHRVLSATDDRVSCSIRLRLVRP